MVPAARLPKDLAFLGECLKSFVLDGGKRIRPQLCIWTFAQAGGSSAPASCRRAACSIACGWELFHAFLLVHDDLIDHADSRRHRPSLHLRLASRGRLGGRLGEDLAIVAGDLLFSAAMKAFGEPPLPHDIHGQLLALFTRVAVTTGLGQALDIVQSHAPLARIGQRQLLREYHWKTAAYTFEGPMLTGAILAGADEGTLASLSRFSLALGQAYQLQNDLIDLSQPAHEGCDLMQGKRTLTLLEARRSMAPRRRRWLDAALADLPQGNGQALGLAEELRHALLDCGAAGRTQSLIERFLADARRAARSRALSRGLARGLVTLLDSLEAQYFADAQTRVAAGEH